MAMYGPFWCQKQNSWLRFETDNGVLTVQQSQRSAANPRLSLAWEPLNLLDSQAYIWTVQNEGEIKTLAWNQGRLFETDWKHRRLAGLDSLFVSQWNPVNSSWSQCILDNPSNGSPILSSSKPDPDVYVVAKDMLPLTPELQETTWAEWKENNLRGPSHVPSVVALLGDEANWSIDGEFRLLIIPTPLVDESAQSYHDRLDDIIVNTENERYKSIQTMAARTHHFRDMALEAEDIRLIQQQIMAYCLNTLAYLRNSLAETFGIEARPMPASSSSAYSDPIILVEDDDDDDPALFDRSDAFDFVSSAQASDHEERRQIELALQNSMQNDPVVAYDDLFQVDEWVAEDEEMREALARSLSPQNPEQGLVLVSGATQPWYDSDVSSDDEDAQKLLIPYGRNRHPAKIEAVIPAKAGIYAQNGTEITSGMDPRLRGDDKSIHSLNNSGMPVTPVPYQPRPGAQQEPELFLVSDKSATQVDLPTAIKQAVARAQGEYSRWYNLPFFGQEIVRRKNGFLSKIITHTQNGQDFARDFRRRINELKGDAVTDLINDFLTNPATHYHVHSFATFLLDALSPLEGTPWHGMKANEQGKYDQGAIRSYIELNDSNFFRL